MGAATGGYRADIDGLRAVAVLPVLLFHAGVAGFGGGYVGVDVFFVISGYLITGILLGDIARGSYSIARFYERRIRRIFPALTVVVLACLLLGWFVLTPDEYRDVGGSAIAVAAFVSNFYFWRSVDYFADAGAIQPLLHTWSLAVEEQFYIFFPPMLAWLARRGRRVVPILIALAAISFVTAAILVFKKPSATFYLPFTRAWELLVGALLAAHRFRPDASSRTRGAAAMLGLALTIVPIMLYNAKTVFPGLAALPPVLGAALIIWAGERGSPYLAGRLLAAAPMTFVGRISYSLYLWHVPVFAFAIYLAGGKLSPVANAAAIALSLVLAWASYRWVETPFRVPPPRGVRRPARIGAAGMLAVLAAGVAIFWSAGAPSRLSPAGAALIDVVKDKQRFHAECMSVGNTIVPPAQACRLGTKGVAPSVLLWGDSHAMVVATPLELAARRRHAALLFAATADCPPGLGFTIDQGTMQVLTQTPSYRFCARYNEEMLELARRTPSIRRVVLASRWSNWRIGEPANPAESEADIRLRDADGVAGSTAENAAKFERGFLRLIAELRAAGKDVVIVGPLPEPTFNVPHRLFVEQFGLAGRAEPVTIAQYRQRHRRILTFFAGLQRRDGVSFVWPTAVLCRDGLCPIEDGAEVMFFDHNHLSIRAARRTAVLYDPVFALPAGPAGQGLGGGSARTVVLP